MKSKSLSVETRYLDAMDEVQRTLASLSIVRGRPITVKGLRGWVFEQTVRTCIEEELTAMGVTVTVQEQVSIGGRATVDLLIGSIAIEVKAAGFCQNVSERYAGYRRLVEAKGWQYFYITLQETYKPYVQIAVDIFGQNRAFFLDQEDGWKLFISEIAAVLSP